MKGTTDMRQELMESANLDQFLSENKENFCSVGISGVLRDMLRKRKTSKAALARRSGMSEVYLHQIFSGQRNPSRNRIICLCFGLKASVEEAQDLLKKCGFAQLYAKNRRDAIILYGLQNSMDLFAVDDKLFAEKEETLRQ